MAIRQSVDQPAAQDHGQQLINLRAATQLRRAIASGERSAAVTDAIRLLWLQNQAFQEVLCTAYSGKMGWPEKASAKYDSRLHVLFDDAPIYLPGVSRRAAISLIANIGHPVVKVSIDSGRAMPFTRDVFLLAGLENAAQVIVESAVLDCESDGNYWFASPFSAPIRRFRVTKASMRHPSVHACWIGKVAERVEVLASAFGVYA